MKMCEYGCNQPAIHQFKSNKKWCCSINVNSCPAKKSRDSEKKKGKPINWKNGEHPKGMKGKKPWNKGHTYEELYGKEKSKKLKEKISKSLKGINNWENMSQSQVLAAKEKLRQKINERYKNGWLPKAGRCKKYTYNSHIAGKVSLDGTWELMVAKWLDNNNIKWTRNTTRFKYVHLNGKDSYYVPDFWVEDWNSYLEVKGYETNLDRCKWEQFEHNLIIWKKKDIEKIMEDGQDGNAADC